MIPITGCPSNDDLLEYVELAETSIHSDSDRAVITVHIETCTNCQSVLDRITDPGNFDFFRLKDFSPAEIRNTATPSMPSLVQLRKIVTIANTNDFPDDSPSFDPNAPARETTIGKFKILEELGSGSGGVVFKAIDAQLNRIVAIKMLRPTILQDTQAIASLRREAKNLASLKHPNVLTLHETGQLDDGIPYLIFEFVEGDSLQQILKAEKVLPVAEAVGLAREIANGLSAAHEIGLVHRDIKPSNVIVQSQSRLPKIVDFGLSISSETNPKISETGMVAGTPAYMSPEQTKPGYAIDWRTDVYSLGILLYECLTGEVPFRGISKQTLERIANEIPIDPRMLNPSIPPDVATITLKAIAKEPRRRYQSAQEMAADLDRWLEKKPILARPVSKFEQGKLWCKRNQLTSVLVATVAFLLLALTIGSLVSSARMSVANP